MLHYFPTPYPDELWYSVLCRYHVRTGNSGSAATFRELFGNRDNAIFSSFMPNGLMKRIADQLPEGVLDVENLALNHTLFPYRIRFRSIEEKHFLLESAKMGKTEFKMNGREAVSQLKICPMCMREDLEQCGEIYWHVSHQIPSASICLKHGCRLKQAFDCSKKELNNNLFLPEESLMETVEFEVKPAEVEFTRVLMRYLELPFELGPTSGYNNLYEGLLNAGYGTVRKDHYYSVDYKRVGEDLCKKFGEEFAVQHFGGTSLRAAIFGNIRYWKCQIPERYASLSLLIGLEPETLFAAKKIENKMDQAFRELAKSPILVSKKYAAEKLGVREKQLDIISHNLGIAPFWEQKSEIYQYRKNRCIVYLADEEKTFLESYTKTMGFSGTSAFFRYLLSQDSAQKTEEISSCKSNKESDEKKQNQYNFYVSDQEFDKLKKEVRKYGLSHISEYMRFRFYRFLQMQKKETL